MLSDVDYASNNRRDVQAFLCNIHGSCLEIGSGNGGFARELLAKFPISTYHAYEPSGSHKVEVPDQRLKVFSTYFEGSENVYDFIFLNDVIEHMEDPIGFLRGLVKNTHKKTKIFVSIPNFRNIQIIHKIANGTLKYEPIGIMDKTHLRIFTRGMARHAFEESPFEIIGMHLLNKHVYLPPPTRLELLFYKLAAAVLHKFIPDFFYLQILVIAQPVQSSAVCGRSE